MTGNDYQMLAARTINKELRNDEKVLHALHGISSKLGEIHGIYQKAYHGHDLDTAHIIHIMGELGDLMWFVAELCTAKSVCGSQCTFERDSAWAVNNRGAESLGRNEAFYPFRVHPQKNSQEKGRCRWMQI